MLRGIGCTPGFSRHSAIWLSAMTQHTPGPWKVQRIETAHHGYAGWQTFAIRGPQNVCLATVGNMDRYESERIPANARLIAAAPEMLKIARAVLAAYEREELRGLTVDEVNEARAAIRAATGVEP